MSDSAFGGAHLCVNQPCDDPRHTDLTPDEWHVQQLRAENEALKAHGTLDATAVTRLIAESVALRAENAQLREELTLASDQAQEVGRMGDAAEAEVVRLRAVANAAKEIALRDSPTHKRLREALAALEEPGHGECGDQAENHGRGVRQGADDAQDGQDKHE
jgi:hypothetical protein